MYKESTQNLCHNHGQCKTEITAHLKIWISKIKLIVSVVQGNELSSKRRQAITFTNTDCKTADIFFTSVANKITKENILWISFKWLTEVTYSSTYFLTDWSALPEYSGTWLWNPREVVRHLYCTSKIFLVFAVDTNTIEIKGMCHSVLLCTNRDPFY